MSEQHSFEERQLQAQIDILAHQLERAQQRLEEASRVYHRADRRAKEAIDELRAEQYLAAKWQRRAEQWKEAARFYRVTRSFITVPHRWQVLKPILRALAGKQ